MAVAAASIASAAAAQSFSAVYDAMPSMTLDQQFSALANFQKANPYFACTYIQLGSVSEKKMIIYDPLRETESIGFWAGNAKLYYGNLKVYYKNGDVRDEYYENIKIPFAGKKVTDDDLWAYVNHHLNLCKNYNDTITLIYTAIEQSRVNYNKSIEEFQSICNDYSDMNDMLLRYDDALAKRLASLKSHSDECFRQFDEYKRLTKIYPLANYRQIYEKVPIETFRLDGLTNSDFFSNRFNIWDYSAWIENFNNVFNQQIKPLRQDVERINKAYVAARKDFESGKVLTSASYAKPYDEYFSFRLGHFDVGSIVDALFDYQDATREMLVMAGDSLGRDLGTDLTLVSRKMRRLANLTQLAQTAADKRQTLASLVSANSVARFTDFFRAQYGGEQGLSKFIANDDAYCQGIIDQMSDATASYIARVNSAATQAVDTYSTASSAAAPSVPLWITLDPSTLTSKYVSTQVSRGPNGGIAAVSGHQKANAQSWFVAGITPAGATQWLLKLSGVNQVTRLSALADGVMAAALRQLKPVIIYIDANGKEAAAVSTDSEIIDFMDRDGVTGNIFWTEGNDQNAPSLSMAAEGAAAKSWSAPLTGLAKAMQVSVVADGFVVSGLTPAGEFATVRVSSDGMASDPAILTPGVADVIATQRVSSSQMSALVETASGSHKYVSYEIK